MGGNPLAIVPIMVVALLLAVAHALLYEWAFTFSMFFALLFNLLLIAGLFSTFSSDADGQRVVWRITAFFSYTILDVAFCVFLLKAKRYMLSERYMRWTITLWSFEVSVKEWLRPWKLVTFVIGLGLLVLGAHYYEIADWDVGISITMATLTYICAPWSVRTVFVCLRTRPPYWILWLFLALLLTWAVVDGSYVLYNEITHHPLMRDENLYVSSLLYIIAGIIWSYGGSLREFFDEFRIAYRKTRNIPAE